MPTTPARATFCKVDQLEEIQLISPQKKTPAKGVYLPGQRRTCADTPRSPDRGRRQQRGAHARSGRPVIRIAISVEAFEAIARTLPLGSVAVEAEANERGERLIWLEAAMVDRLGARQARKMLDRRDRNLVHSGPPLAALSPSVETIFRLPGIERQWRPVSRVRETGSSPILWLIGFPRI